MPNGEYVGEAKAKLTLDTSEIGQNLIDAVKESQKNVDKNPVKIRLELDESIMKKQIQKNQTQLMKELQSAYNKYADFKLDDASFAKAIQVYIASGGELTREFERIAVSYKDLKDSLGDKFIPITEIEKFKDSLAEIDALKPKIDFSGVDFEKLEQLNTTLKKIYTDGYLNAEISDEEFIAYVKDFEKQGGIFTSDLKEIKETYEQYADDIANIEIPNLSIFNYGDPTLQLQKLFEEIKQYANDNGINKLDNYFIDLEKSIANGDISAQNMLKTLGLLKGEFAEVISAGNIHYGGITGDDITLLSQRDNGKRYNETLKLKETLEKAAEEGINVARILDVVKDKESDLFIELQETAPGKMLAQTFNPFGEEFDYVNLEALEATDEQIKKFIEDLIRLNELGIGVDFNTTNFMFDKEKGFYFIDLDLNPEKFENTEEIVVKAKRLLSDIREYYDEIEDTSKLPQLDAFENRFSEIGNSLAKSMVNGYAEGQDSHSPSKEAQRLVSDFADGVTEGSNVNKDKVHIAGETLASEFINGYDEKLKSLNEELSLQGKEVPTSADNKSLEELIQIYHQLGTSNGASEELKQVSDAILGIVQSEKQLNVDEMQQFVKVLRGLTFIDGDSPILKMPYTINEAIDALNKLKGIQSSITPLFQEPSGQLSFFDGTQQTIKTQEKIQGEIKETNDAIKGQITLEEHLKSIQLQQPKSDNESNLLSGNISSEISDMLSLKSKIDNVTSALNEKTKSIKAEENQMRDSADKEVKSLIAIENKVNDVKNGLKNIGALEIPVVEKKDKKSSNTNGSSSNDKADKQIKYIESLRKKAKNVLNSFEINKSDLSGFEAYDDKLKELQNTISSISGKNDLDIFIKNLKDIGIELNKIDKKDIQLLNFNQQLSEIKAASDGTQAYQKQIQALESAIERYKSVNVLDESQRDTFKKAKKDVDDLIKSFNNANDTSISKLSSNMTKWLRDNTAASKEARLQVEGFVNELKDPAITQFRRNQIAEEFNKISASAEKGLSIFDQIKSRFKSLIAYLGSFASFYQIVGAFKQGFNTIKELDTALVDVRKTFQGTDSDLIKMYNNSSSLAKQLGVTTEEIINQEAAWSRAGYSIKNTSEEMAKISSIFKSISPDMDTDMAQTGLISVMKAFDIEVDEVERKVVDNVNAIGNSMATTNTEIIEGLERSSSAMAAANNSLEQTIALFGAGQEIIQNAESVGSALKTMSMRIRGYDEETEELLEDYENLSGTIADLTKTVSTPGGISLFTDETKQTYKSTYEILKDISEIWDDLSDKNRAKLLEKLFAKTRANTGAAILENFSAAEQALKTMENAAGSSDAEMENIRQSIEFKLNSLSQTWVGTLQNLIDRGTVGKIIDMLTSLSEGIGTVLTKFSELNLILPTAIGGISSYFLRKNSLDQPARL